MIRRIWICSGCGQKIEQAPRDNPPRGCYGNCNYMFTKKRLDLHYLIPAEELNKTWAYRGLGR
jgi:hypothetical protein